MFFIYCGKIYHRLLCIKMYDIIFIICYNEICNLAGNSEILFDLS